MILSYPQEHFLKSSSVNTVHRAFHKCRLKLCCAKKKPCTKKATAFSGFKIACDKVENTSFLSPQFKSLNL